MPKRIGKYQLGDTLGRGTFSKVKYAVDTETKLPYAIKIVDRKMIRKERMEEQLKREIAIMKILKHKHVVGLREVLQSSKHIYIVLELITGGELFDRIVSLKKFDEPTARKFFQQLINGVEYCHAHGIAHRDLKPENLLLDVDDNLKISDFGLSALSTNTGDGRQQLLMTTCGTPNYVA
jgi:serine/threonine protein kinase